MPVAVRVGRVRHLRVGGGVVQQAGELPVDGPLLGPDEAERPGIHALGTLGGVAHDEHGLAERGGFLLDAARVGKDEVATRHEVVEVHDFQRVDDPKAVEAVQLLVGGLAHLRVHVDGVDRLGIGPFLHDPADGAEHAVHGLAQVLPAVRGDEDEPAPLRPVERGVRVSLPDRVAEGVDAGVAGDEDSPCGLRLIEEVPPRGVRGREVPPTDDVHRLAVELLRPGAVEVPRAEAGLHVPHGDLEVERRERRREGRGGVAVDEDDVGALPLQHRFDLEQHIRGDVEQRLAGPHDGEVVVGDHAEHGEHLVEHLAVLAGDADDRLELLGPRLELERQRAHLDGLRAGAEDEHDLLFCHEKLPIHFLMYARAGQGIIA